MKASKISLLFSLLSLFIIIQSTKTYAKPQLTASSYGGIYDGWPTSWKSIDALNDPDDSLANERIDFVGDATNPGAYYAGDADYLFFRIRMDDGTATAFSDTIMILIDRGQNGTLDYAFMWDSNSPTQTDHGLELGVPSVEGTTWANTRVTDADGLAAKKQAPPDFGLTNGDGYIRILNGQSTTNFGTTTFVDFAISWSYLYTNTSLRKDESWDIQLASINNATDHNDIKYDVAGNLTPDDPRTFPSPVGFGPTAIQLDTFQTINNGSDILYVVLYGAFILLSVLLLGSRAIKRR